MGELVFGSKQKKRHTSSSPVCCRLVCSSYAFLAGSSGVKRLEKNAQLVLLLPPPLLFRESDDDEEDDDDDSALLVLA
eukprot:CAMPEP_0171978264 /NCGR_PEP_ID=MMETSP0993-20121228/251113_1 /TAXON_ID=483369 /ORGANISM="non described non described, Strain CCMP2098" /LENGTH=77 /DNA_ID=CAMNT_0012630151 /DNA_START=209 /DNA_END=438 /DNA_ORIENTATION=+